MLKRTATTFAATMMSLLSFALLATLFAGCGDDKEAKNMATKYRVEITSAKNQISALAAATNKSKRENELLTLQVKRQTDELTACVTRAQTDGSEITDMRSKLTVSEQALKALRTEYDALLAEKNELKQYRDATEAKKTADIWLIFHYWRPDNAYDDWGIVFKGGAVLKASEWAHPKRFKESDDFGAIAKTKLHPDFYKTMNAQFFLKNNEGDRDAASSGVRNLVMSLGPVPTEVDTSKHTELWVLSGDPTLYYSAEDALEQKRVRMTDKAD